MCKIAVGVVGENAGSRHVATVNVGGWDEKRRSCQRLQGRLPPRDKVVIVQRLCGMLALSGGAKSEVLGARCIVPSGVLSAGGCARAGQEVSQPPGFSKQVVP